MSEILTALAGNVLSWFVSQFFPFLMPRLLPQIAQEDTTTITATNNGTTQESTSNHQQTQCVAIGRPGGSEQLRVITLKPGVVTCGYNIPNHPPPFTTTSSSSLDNNKIPSDCVILKNEAFSVNYADCCIRWGLYESANRFVGWPICPGFDVAGIVETVGGSGDKNDNDFKKGDRVFGCTLFGAYSSKVLVPKVQLKKIPAGLTTQQAAALPAVSLTALYALFLAGQYGNQFRLSNRAILIHSAAGGVGMSFLRVVVLFETRRFVVMR